MKIGYERCEYEALCWYSTWHYYSPVIEEERQRIIRQYPNVKFSDDLKDFHIPGKYTQLTIQLKFRNKEDEAEFILREAS